MSLSNYAKYDSYNQDIQGSNQAQNKRQLITIATDYHDLFLVHLQTLIKAVNKTNFIVQIPKSYTA